MIAEIIPEAYDASGRKALRPDWRRKGLHPTFPMGRYVSQRLTVKCESVWDVRKFLLQFVLYRRLGAWLATDRDSPTTLPNS